MNIKAVDIYGLFRKYNVSIDMSRKSNILVGANGIGKTTILRMLECINNWNYVDLASFPFIKISVYLDNNEEISFTREELLPTQQYIIERYCIHYHEKSAKWLENVFSHLTSNNLFCDFVYHLYKYGTNSKIVKDCILECASHVEVFQSFNEYFADKIRECMDNFVDGHFFNSTPIRDLLINKNIWHKIGSKNSFLVNLVSGIEFEILTEPIYSSKTLQWLRSAGELGCNRIEYDEWNGENLKSNEMIWDFAWLQSAGSRLAIPSYFFRVGGETILDFWKYMYANLNDLTTYVFYKNEKIHKQEWITVQQHCLEKFSEKNIFCLNELIASNYYEQEIANKFNHDMADFCIDIADGVVGYGAEFESATQLLWRICDFLKIEEEQIEIFDEFDDDDEDIAREKALGALNLFFNNPEVRYNIENYFIPILAKHFPIDFSLIYSDAGNVEITGDDDQYDYLALCFEFYVREVNLFTEEENRSETIKLFQKQVESYFPNRRILITPAGFRFFNFVDKYEKGDKQTSDSFSGEISINSISSGEKKIILLLALAYLMKDVIVLIDEPELSLSIVWQQQIIHDLQQGKLRNVTIATHSPYLVSSEETSNSVIYLPMEDYV